MTTGGKVSLAVLVFLRAFGVAAAQEWAASAEKSRLIVTLLEIQDRTQKLRDTYRHSSLAAVTETMHRSARWFSNAATRWSPKKRGEGQPLVTSMDRMVRVLRKLPEGEAELKALLSAISDDLSVKEEHCRRMGLAAPQRVLVITRKNGIEEVKGLAVLYLEKFFESDPNAQPQEFRGFSSPAVDDLVPGRYIVWAKATDGSARMGPRKEARIGNGFPKEPIEVLTP